VKTISLKKVAVIAVASLGFGLLSVVPANAADTKVTEGTISDLNATKATANTNVTGTTNKIVVGATNIGEAAIRAGEVVTWDFESRSNYLSSCWIRWCSR